VKRLRGSLIGKRLLLFVRSEIIKEKVHLAQRLAATSGDIPRRVTFKLWKGRNPLTKWSSKGAN